MLKIETAKKQAETMADYLRTVGKKLKHTHALEAVARMNGHKTWNIFQSAAVAAGDVGEADTTAKTPADLVELFFSDSVEYVMLDGVRYELNYYDSEVLGQYSQIVRGGGDDMQSVGVILTRNEQDLVWEEELTVERLSKTFYQPDGSWMLGEGARMELFATVAVKPA
jgi:hypothetical protein